MIGSARNDYGYTVAVDCRDNVYIAGATGGRLGSPEQNAGGDDVFVAKFSATGTHAWVHGLGSHGDDRAYGIAVDAAGSAYVTGTTEAHLPGEAGKSAGRFDAFIAKYSTHGNRAWVRGLGSPDNDYGYGVAVDRDGSALVAGATESRLSGSPEARAGRLDAFVAKYSTHGTRAWVRQLGSTGTDAGYGIAVDGAGDAYATGATDGRLPGSPEANAGADDAFVAKYSKMGAQLWVHQLGSGGSDAARGAGVDASGAVYVTGMTNSRLPGAAEKHAGDFDVFVAKYSGSGARAWVHQRGSVGEDDGLGIAVDGSGNTTVTGRAFRLPGAPEGNRGGLDVFLERNL